MNQDDIDKISDPMKRIEMTKEKENEIRAKLIEYTLPNAANESKFQDEMNQPIASPYGGHFKKSPAIALLVLFLFSGTVSSAAEFALPGETLYPVKINFNEKIQSAFTINDEEKIELNTHLIEKRLEEAEKLSNQSKLSSTTIEILNAAVEKHLKVIEEKIVKLPLDKQMKALENLNKIGIDLESYLPNIEELDEENSKGTGESVFESEP